MEQIGFISITANDLRGLIAGAVAEVLKTHQGAGQPAPQEPPDELLSRKETAKLLRVSLLTLRNWETRGVLRPRRLSRRVLYLKSEVLAALKTIRR